MISDSIHNTAHETLNMSYYMQINMIHIIKANVQSEVIYMILSDQEKYEIWSASEILT